MNFQNKRTLTAVIAICILLLLTACGGRQSQQESSAGYELTLDTMSSAVGPTQLMITVVDSTGTPVTDATLDIKGDMTHAGMQPVLATTAVNENGVYAADFEWTMAGDWIVTVEATLNDGTMITERFEGIQIGEETMEEMDHSDMEMDN